MTSTPNQTQNAADLYALPELTDLSLRSIALYQSQGHLIDRLWAYLNHYCIIILLLGIAAVPFPAELRNVHVGMLAIPAFAFVAFSVANFISLRHALSELHALRAVAAQTSRLPLSGSGQGLILRWHITAVVLSLGVYVICWTYVHLVALK